MSSRSKFILQKALEISNSTKNQGENGNLKVNLKNASTFGENPLKSLDNEQCDFPGPKAGPSRSCRIEPKGKNFTEYVNNDSLTDSEDEPYQPDSEGDEFIPDNLSEDSENSSDDSSDTDECQIPKKAKTLEFEIINSAINLIQSDVAATENKNKDKDLTEEKQTKKKKVFKLEEKTTRKRQKKTNMWKKNIAATARQRGQTYVNQKGKVIPEKTVNSGTLCKNNCKKKCSDKLEAEQRNNIFTRFYMLDENLKNMLLFKSMTFKVPARPQKNAARHKSASFIYKVTINNNTEVTLCKKAFCSLYQIGKKKVEYLQKGIKEGLHAPNPNKRGKHDNRPHKITDDIKEYVMEHIRLFPATESHYSRYKNPHKKYLSPILNISKMYKLYQGKCLEENKDPRFNIKYCTYSKIFSTEFNYSFGEPRSDTCSTCDSGKGNEEHKENFEAAFALQRADRDHAKNSEGVCYLTMDLQQTFPLPKLSTNKAFYLRQMWMYNLGIHSITKNTEKGNFFTWTEDMAHRGSVEVCSALLTMLEYNVPDNAISHVILWTDSCAGQNKNFLMICLYQYLILKGTVKVIDHKFPEVGHSYLDSDRDFGRIEKVLRRHENIYLPDEYRTIISQSSKKNYVTDMLQHFRKFDDLATKLNLINRKKNTLNENVSLRDGIKWIRVCKYGSYLYKENFDPNTPFKEVNLIRNSRIPPPDNVDIERTGTKTGQLSAEKIANLKSQVQYVKEPFRWYYNTIIAEQESKA